MTTRRDHIIKIIQKLNKQISTFGTYNKNISNKYKNIKHKFLKTHSNYTNFQLSKMSKNRSGLKLADYINTWSS
jgi:hypothetical protein